MPFLLVWWVSCLATLSFPLSAGSVFAQQVAIAEEEEIIETREVIVSATKCENGRGGTSLGARPRCISKRRTWYYRRRPDARGNARADSRLDRRGDRQ